jgi:hypothetical protein
VTTESQVVDGRAEDIRWVARVCGLLVVGLYVLILIFAFTNEDAIQAQAVPKIVLMSIAMLGVGLAWRWERVGGAVLVASAVTLGLSMYESLPIFGFTGLLMVVLIYAIPPLCAGVLFLLSGRRV